MSSEVMFELMGIWEEQKVRWDSESGIYLRINFVVEHLGIGDAVRDTIARFNEQRGEVSVTSLAQTVSEKTIVSQSRVCLPNRHPGARYALSSILMSKCNGHFFS